MPVVTDHLRDVEGHVARERGAVLELTGGADATLAVLLVDLRRPRERTEQEPGERVIERVPLIVERKGSLVDGFLERLIPSVVAGAEAKGVFEREVGDAVRGDKGRDTLDSGKYGVCDALADRFKRDAKGQHVGGTGDVEGVGEASL